MSPSWHKQLTDTFGGTFKHERVPAAWWVLFFKLCISPFISWSLSFSMAFSFLSSSIAAVCSRLPASTKSNFWWVAVTEVAVSSLVKGRVRFRLGRELGWNPSLHYTYKQSMLLQDRMLFFVWQSPLAISWQWKLVICLIGRRSEWSISTCNAFRSYAMYFRHIFGKRTTSDQAPRPDGPKSHITARSHPRT